MDDNRIPKQLFYGLNIGKRKACKPKLSFKDRLKNTIKLTNLSVDNWEVDALDRSQWRNKVSKGISTFESNRISNASFKRAIRKGEDVVPNRNNPLVGFKCQTCGMPCLSLAGLKSHKRSHIAKRPIVYNIINDKVCPICTKVCLSAAGLKRHIKVHNRAPAVEHVLNPCHVLYVVERVNLLPD